MSLKIVWSNLGLFIYLIFFFLERTTSLEERLKFEVLNILDQPQTEKISKFCHFYVTVTPNLKLVVILCFPRQTKTTQ